MWLKYFSRVYLRDYTLGMKIEIERLHQDNTKAEIYRRLRNAGVGCCLEYRHKIEGRRACVFDLVVIQKGCIVLIVEAKSSANWNWKCKRQHAKYSRFSVPIWLVTSFCQAKSVACEIIDHVHAGKGFSKFRCFRSKCQKQKRRRIAASRR